MPCSGCPRSEKRKTVSLDDMGRHFSTGINEALGGVAVLVIPPQCVQLVVAKLRHRSDGLLLACRDLEDKRVRLDMLDAARRDS